MSEPNLKVLWILISSLTITSKIVIYLLLKNVSGANSVQANMTLWKSMTHAHAMHDSPIFIVLLAVHMVVRREFHGFE